jgi:hypothetical protein
MSRSDPTIHLRISEALSAALAQLGADRGTSLNAEARRLLEEGVGAAPVRPVEAALAAGSGIHLEPRLAARVRAYGSRVSGGLDVSLDSAVVLLLARALDRIDAQSARDVGRSR